MPRSAVDLKQQALAVHRCRRPSAPRRKEQGHVSVVRRTDNCADRERHAVRPIILDKALEALDVDSVQAVVDNVIAREVVVLHDRSRGALFLKRPLDRRCEHRPLTSAGHHVLSEHTLDIAACVQQDAQDFRAVPDRAVSVGPLVFGQQQLLRRDVAQPRGGGDASVKHPFQAVRAHLRLEIVQLGSLVIVSEQEPRRCADSLARAVLPARVAARVPCGRLHHQVVRVSRRPAQAVVGHRRAVTAAGDRQRARSSRRRSTRTREERVQQACQY